MGSPQHSSEDLVGDRIGPEVADVAALRDRLVDGEPLGLAKTRLGDRDLRMLLLEPHPRLPASGSAKARRIVASNSLARSGSAHVTRVPSPWTVSKPNPASNSRSSASRTRSRETSQTITSVELLNVHILTS